MTRKDYVLIAGVIFNQIDTARAMDEPHGVIALESAARAFARMLAGDNPRFDGHKFLAACGITV